MLRFAKKDVRSLYRVTGPDHRFGLLRGRSSWSAGSIAVDDDELEFGTRDGSRIVEVSRRADVTARATPGSSLTTWAIESGATSLVLSHSSFRRYDATVDGVAGGAVELVGAAGRRIETSLPDSCTLDVQLLASFVAIAGWNRAATS